MTIQTLLSPNVPPLKSTDTVEVALDLLSEFKVHHLPVINDLVQFIGTVSEEQLLNAPSPELPVKMLIENVAISVAPETHAFDATNLMVRHQLSTLPIVDADGHYIGLVEQHDLFGLFAHMLSTEEKGAILILEIMDRDYSLGQLAYIVEQSSAKILSLSSERRVSADQPIRITLKLNVQDTARIRHVLEHHGYKVIGTFGDEETQEELQERVLEFMRYLEV